MLTYKAINWIALGGFHDPSRQEFGIRVSSWRFRRELAVAGLCSGAERFL
jgi:hypothetical protein